MIFKGTLVSGNVFYYFQEPDFIDYGIVLSKDNKVFIGAFLDNHAKLKFKTFQQNGVKFQTLDTQDFSWDDVCLKQFAEKLGSASRLFERNFTKTFSDKKDCCGTSSLAKSCDERHMYYNAVGCQNIYDSDKKVRIGVFIANHLSVFSTENFQKTFFSGNEEDTEFYADSIVHNIKFSWSKNYFKAPAYYVKSLCEAVG